MLPARPIQETPQISALIKQNEASGIVEFRQAIDQAVKNRDQAQGGMRQVRCSWVY